MAGQQLSIDSGDTAWMLVSTALVMLMLLPGLALFYGGLVRAKNLLSVMSQVLGITAIAILTWVLWDYSLAFYDGGALLPFGGHKGSGISLLAQILGRGISGMLPDMLAEHRGANGPFVLAIDIGRFGPLATFFEAVESTADEVHRTPPAEGFDRVLLPGEPELETRKKRGAEGIPVPDTTWNELTALAKELAVYREEWDR